MPAGIVRRLLTALDPDELTQARIEAAGLSPRLLRGIQAGEQERLSFDTVERIIVGVLGDESLWHTEPELAAIFERS